VGQLRRTGVACHIPVAPAGRAGAASLRHCGRRYDIARDCTRAVVFCEGSVVVSGSFADRGSWPVRGRFYGGRRPATVEYGEEVGGRLWWLGRKKHRLFG
jgi:hypothetical protein